MLAEKPTIVRSVFYKAPQNYAELLQHPAE